MTAKQITRKLTAAGFNVDNFKASRDEVETAVILDADGDLDFDATEELADRIGQALGWGGFRCGSGAWVLRAGYVSNTLDPCDTANPIHY